MIETLLFGIPFSAFGLFIGLLVGIRHGVHHSVCDLCEGSRG